MSFFSHNTFHQNDKNRKSRITFPWWCLLVAYGICLILIGVCTIFIIGRGIEFGDIKSQKWLTSILSGVFSSILLTEPLKVKVFVDLIK